MNEALCVMESMLLSRGGKPAAPCLASCGSETHVEQCVSYMYLLHLSSIRYLCLTGNYGGDVLVSPLVLCGSS